MLEQANARAQAFTTKFTSDCSTLLFTTNQCISLVDSKEHQKPKLGDEEKKARILIAERMHSLIR